jgi:hypothetical protein
MAAYLARLVLLWWVSHAGTVELACCALCAVPGRQGCEGDAALCCSSHKLHICCVSSEDQQLQLSCCLTCVSKWSYLSRPLIIHGINTLFRSHAC